MLHSGMADGMLYSAMADGMLYIGVADGMLHSGMADGMLHSGMADGVCCTVAWPMVCSVTLHQHTSAEQHGVRRQVSDSYLMTISVAADGGFV